MNCPVCGNENIASNQCPQCKSDLTTWFRLKALPETYYAEGIELVKTGDWDGAIEKFLTAISLNFRGSSVHVVLAHAYEKKGLYEAAIEEIDKAIQNDHPDAEALKNHKDRIGRLKDEQNRITGIEKETGRPYKWIISLQAIMVIAFISILLGAYHYLHLEAKTLWKEQKVLLKSFNDKFQSINMLSDNISRLEGGIDKNQDIIEKSLQAKHVNYFSYAVVKGDTLSLIADRFYHNPKHWKRIYKVNSQKISDPNILPIGVILKVPVE